MPRCFTCLLITSLGFELQSAVAGKMQINISRWWCALVLICDPSVVSVDEDLQFLTRLPRYRSVPEACRNRPVSAPQNRRIVSTCLLAKCRSAFAEGVVGCMKASLLLQSNVEPGQPPSRLHIKGRQVTEPLIYPLSSTETMCGKTQAHSRQNVVLSSVSPSSRYLRCSFIFIQV